MGASQILQDMLLWFLGAVATVTAPILAVIKRNRDRSQKNQRRLEGDENDPNSEGVLQIAFQTREQTEALQEKIDQYRHETRREHERVMERLEEMADDS